MPFVVNACDPFLCHGRPNGPPERWPRKIYAQVQEQSFDRAIESTYCCVLVGVEPRRSAVGRPIKQNGLIEKKKIQVVLSHGRIDKKRDH